MLDYIDSKPIDRILIFDWDGVVCNSDSHALKSMEVALRRVAQGYKFSFRKDAFEYALKQTSGTTERNFVTNYLRLVGGRFNIGDHNSIISDFDLLRREYWLAHNVSDRPNIFPDFSAFLRRCQAIDKVNHLNTVYAIATGNPKETFGVRIPDFIAEQMHLIVTGEDSDHRHVLVRDVHNQLESGILYRRYGRKTNVRIHPHNYEEINKHTLTVYLDDTTRAITHLAIHEGPKNRALSTTPNLRLVYVDRKGEGKGDYPGFIFHHLLYRAETLNDQGLMDFVNPKNHGRLEGRSFLEEFNLRAELEARTRGKEQG